MLKNLNPKINLNNKMLSRIHKAHNKKNNNFKHKVNKIYNKNNKNKIFNNNNK